MELNGATFNKAQQDQLKKKVGAELDDVIAKVDDVDSRMLNYTGDWVTGKEYHENNVVTWTDGHLYEVIKAHTSSSTIDPSKVEYYKAMTATKYIQYTVDTRTQDGCTKLNSLCAKARQGKKVILVLEDSGHIFQVGSSIGDNTSLFNISQQTGNNNPLYIYTIRTSKYSAYKCTVRFDTTDSTIHFVGDSPLNSNVTIFVEA